MQKAPDLPEIRVNLALAYFRLQRTADAVAQLEKAAALAPDSPRVLFQLGGAYVEMQALDKAAAAFEKGLAKQSDASDPLVLEATTTLGAVYFAKGENDKAVAQFDKALAAKPDNAAAKLGLGKVYFSKGDVAKALELFQQVVASAPGTPEAAQAEAFIKELKKPQGVSRGGVDMRRALSLSAAAFISIGAAVLFAQEKGGENETGPYDLVAELAPDRAAARGTPGDRPAASSPSRPDRVFIFQRGCLPELKGSGRGAADSFIPEPQRVRLRPVAARRRASPALGSRPLHRQSRRQADRLVGPAQQAVRAAAPGADQPLRSRDSTSGWSTTGRTRSTSSPTTARSW